jgi:hypothetical protein
MWWVTFTPAHKTSMCLHTHYFPPLMYFVNFLTCDTSNTIQWLRYFDLCTDFIT